MSSNFFDPSLFGRNAAGGPRVASGDRGSWESALPPGAAAGGAAPGMQSNRTMFFQQYGTSTPQEIVRNGGVLTNQTAPAPGQPGSSPAGAVSPGARAAAGRMKSLAHHEVPGSQNGNPADGQPSAEMGVGPQFFDMGNGTGNDQAIAARRAQWQAAQARGGAPNPALAARTPVPVAQDTAATQAAAAMVAQPAAQPIVAPETAAAPVVTEEPVVAQSQQRASTVTPTANATVAQPPAQTAPNTVHFQGRDYPVTGPLPTRLLGHPEAIKKWLDAHAWTPPASGGGASGGGGQTDTGNGPPAGDGTTTPVGTQDPAKGGTDETGQTGSTNDGSPVYHANNNGNAFEVDQPVPAWFPTATVEQRQAWIDQHKVAAQDEYPTDDELAYGEGKGATGNQATWGRGTLDEITSIIQDQDGQGRIKWYNNLWSQGLGLTPQQIKAMGARKLPNPYTSGPWRQFDVNNDASYAIAIDGSNGIQHPEVTRLLTFAAQKAQEMRRLLDDEGTSAFRGQTFATLSRQLAVAEAALDPYGVHFDGNAYAGITLGGDGTGTGTGDEPTDTGYDEQGNFHLSTQLPSFSRNTLPKELMSLFASGGKELAPEQKQAAFELAMQMYMAERGMSAQDFALQTAQGTMDANLNDPLFKELLKQALETATNPQTSDWAGIRARELSGSAKSLQSAGEALARTGARRGVSTASQAEQGTRLAMDESARMAGRLGELSQKEIEERRMLQDRGMGYLQTGATMGAGIRSGGAGDIERIAMGVPPQGANPLGGFANAGLGLFGTQMAKDQQDAAGEQTTLDKFSQGLDIVKGLFSIGSGIGAF